MPAAKTIVLSLSGPSSHSIVHQPGRGDLRIGPASPGDLAPDVVVAPDDALDWSTFDPLKVPAGYPWPRAFHYSGNDRGFFAWSTKRRIETFEWTPLTDALVDASSARIDRLALDLRAASLEIVLPKHCEHVAISGDPRRLRPRLAAGATCPSLTFQPTTTPSRRAAPIALPRFDDLASAISVEVSVAPLRQPFDCASLLQFPNLESVALSGHLARLTALAELTKLESLSLRYCPDLASLPSLATWPRLTELIGWNIEETAGKRLRAEIKTIAKSAGREWSHASATQLRRPEWFTTEYGLPFSSWPKRLAKSAVRAYRSAETSIAAARSKTSVERAIRGFVRI
ncbi:MAG: leucine-rich repeat domain-containing protein, partial [Myxococcales bacterium]|nr:leucine-rich repeat domain-containing protein [Myxococcales bacterium]